MFIFAGIVRLVIYVISPPLHQPQVFILVDRQPEEVTMVWRNDSLFYYVPNFVADEQP